MSTHTPGPWQWYLDDTGIDLRTPHSGQLLVMDYGGKPTKRPVLRFAERTDSMGGLMQTAHNLVKTRHSRPGFVEIDNPDARLIAAAPCLLEACRSAEARLASMGSMLASAAFEQDRQILCQLRAAIAKAEGRT